MTDEDLDADIERMIAQHHARKTLGWSYFQSNTHRGAERVDDTKRRRQNANRQAAWRAKKS